MHVFHETVFFFFFFFTKFKTERKLIEINPNQVRDLKRQSALCPPRD